jgi:hypothetical protein
MSVQGAGGFAQHARAFVEGALRRTPPMAARDVYVASLLVSDEHNDPLRPTAAVGFNTESAVMAATARGVDPEEARWGYEHWLQNDLGTLAGEHADPAGARLRAHWLAELAVRDGGTPLPAQADIADAFMDMLAGVVRTLHHDGVIAVVFGRPVPVLIHGLEYDEAIADHNHRANPGGLAAAFVRWLTRR